MVFGWICLRCVWFLFVQFIWDCMLLCWVVLRMVIFIHSSCGHAVAFCEINGSIWLACWISNHVAVTVWQQRCIQQSHWHDRQHGCPVLSLTSVGIIWTLKNLHAPI